jgi:hypothetical protein
MLPPLIAESIEPQGMGHGLVAGGKSSVTTEHLRQSELERGTLKSGLEVRLGQPKRRDDAVWNPSSCAQRLPIQEVIRR